LRIRQRIGGTAHLRGRHQHDEQEGESSHRCCLGYQPEPFLGALIDVYAAASPPVSFSGAMVVMRESKEQSDSIAEPPSVRFAPADAEHGPDDVCERHRRYDCGGGEIYR
jgi:hypothetical protein